MLHRQALQSVGIMSIVACHLSAHLSSGLTFDDKDTVFKRAYFRAIAIINNSQPQLTNKNVDFSEDSKRIRIDKFKKNLKKQTLSAVQHKEQQIVLNHVNQNLIKMGGEIESTSTNTTITTASNNNELLDRLYSQLLAALEQNDEPKISHLQLQIATIEPNE